MKTTVDIPDAEYRLLKTKAETQGKTIKELVLQGVRVVLDEKEQPPARRLKFPLIVSDQPGTLDIDNERIYDIIGFP